MIYADLPAGATVFVDATVFIPISSQTAFSGRPLRLSSNASKIKRLTASPPRTFSARSPIA